MTDRQRLARNRAESMLELQIAVAHFEIEKIGPLALFNAAKKAVTAEFMWTMEAGRGGEDEGL